MEEVELHQPDQYVVAKLERILERAKSGEIQGFVLVADIAGGSSSLYQEGTYNRPVLVGQLELLKSRIIYEWANDGEDSEK